MIGTTGSNSVEIETPKTFTDPRDGKQYKIVTIGDQTWMAENLNYNASGGKCGGNDNNDKKLYNENTINCDKYGRLYNWETSRKVCPYGWHLPSRGEWKALMNFAGGEKIAGKKLKAKSGWNYTDDGKSGNGTEVLRLFSFAWWHLLLCWWLRRYWQR